VKCLLFFSLVCGGQVHCLILNSIVLALILEVCDCSGTGRASGL